MREENNDFKSYVGEIKDISNEFIMGDQRGVLDITIYELDPENLPMKSGTGDSPPLKCRIYLSQLQLLDFISADTYCEHAILSCYFNQYKRKAHIEKRDEKE